MERKRKPEAENTGGSLTSIVMQNRRVCIKKAIRFQAKEIVGEFKNEINTWFMG
jgi:hypothetical protein